DVRLCEVLDVDEVPLLLAGSGNHDRLPALGRAHEPGNDQRLPHPRPVRDAVAEDRELLVVHFLVAVHQQLGRDLSRYVKVSGLADVDQRLLSALTDSGRRAVDPHGAGEHDAAAATAPGRIENTARALDVEPYCVHRVGADVVHVGHSGQMKYRVPAADGRGQRHVVEDVGNQVAGRRVGPSALLVDDQDVVASGHEAVDDMRADETASARNRDTHAGSSARASGLDIASQATFATAS